MVEDFGEYSVLKTVIAAVIQKNFFIMSTICVTTAVAFMKMNPVVILNLSIFPKIKGYALRILNVLYLKEQEALFIYY